MQDPLWTHMSPVTPFWHFLYPVRLTTLQLSGSSALSRHLISHPSLANLGQDQEIWGKSLQFPKSLLSHASEYQPYWLLED